MRDHSLRRFKLWNGMWVAASVWVLLVAGSAPSESQVPRHRAPEHAHAYIIDPQSGDSVSSPVTVRFGLSGMGVAPAGVAYAGAGHHHLLVDTGVPALDQPIPSDAHHRHFGKGQTEVSLDLAPGPHTLQLLLGDENHVPHEPPVLSRKIRIEVK